MLFCVDSIFFKLSHMCELTKIQKTCLGHNLRGVLNDKNHKALFRLRAIVEKKIIS